jgi:hypothetical protein
VRSILHIVRLLNHCGFGCLGETESQTGINLAPFTFCAGQIMRAFFAPGTSRGLSGDKLLCVGATEVELLSHWQSVCGDKSERREERVDTVWCRFHLSMAMDLASNILSE